MASGGNYEKPKQPRTTMAGLLKELIREGERLNRRLRSDIEACEAFLWKLYRLERAMADREGPAPACRSHRMTVDEQHPAPSVRSVRLTVMESGRYIAVFDHEKQVTLSPALRELTEILAAETDESPDALVPWKSFEQVREQLEKRLGRRFVRHAVSQLIWRLRQTLRASGLAAELVESVPEQGARLRVQRHASATITPG